MKLPKSGISYRARFLKTYLNDHSVDLVGAELELVAGEGVSQTEGHGAALGLLDTGHLVQILTDSTDQLMNCG